MYGHVSYCGPGVQFGDSFAVAGAGLRVDWTVKSAESVVIYTSSVDRFETDRLSALHWFNDVHSNLTLTQDL